ncbi:hypothetical protein FOIG_13959 [Fusarium odoratissimum NRRL 54006]|uniref:Uncharacterized protein n=2 Tax=Fusarium oxysporum species complex TaxID=171631 RepID=X0J9R9_FUSO5|nr:uncharacterized protein FOIG_13959 [Fusarium odoratissimum NRRL 54006]EXL93075.1 hypothetical protein FOIG_13959 [Fusarium odoratissimum NRRL 54006]TXC11983.1 hypothetical protein FocTR4_00007649 [Fusarium oxysporum f. sp. cubense]
MTRNSSLGEILAPRDAAQLINLDLVNLPNPPNGSIQIHNGSASGGIHTLAGPLVVDGFTVLYKAMDQARLDGLFDPQGVLNRNRICVLLSALPTDSAGPRPCAISLQT